jgi:hypothetical protein
MIRLSSVVIALIAVFGLLPATALAVTATTTTLDVASDSIEIGSGETSGALVVTAHVVPAPQPFNGFIPAVGFLVDGTLNGVAPIDGSGDGSTDVHLSAGTHSIVATFGGLGDFAASESDPATVVATFATAVTLSSNRNPALDTEAVTITASVSPGSITGGTLTVVDSFDGSTIASATVGSGTTSAAVTQVFAEGMHALTATYSGDGDYASSLAHLDQAVNKDTVVAATELSVAYATFYPYPDQYRDTEAIRGRLQETASVLIRIFSPSGSLIKDVNLGTQSPGAYAYAWDGRYPSGAILPEGRYKIIQRLTDVAGNVSKTTFYANLSRKKLIWTTSTISINGSAYFGFIDEGNGSISQTNSAYTRGLLLTSGTSGVAVVYRFTLHSAVKYGASITFGVLGLSPNGRKAYEGLWNRSLGLWTDPDAYDYQTIGPDYGWWRLSGSSDLHLSGQDRAYGSVVVPYTTAVRKFDIAKVRLVYRWAVLG